ncbi:hypothetical protein MHYP_G00334860 [Metynnis hypsauchen]
MGDIPEFKRGQIVGARLVGTSVTKTFFVMYQEPWYPGLMSAYHQEGQTTSNRIYCGRKRKLSERDARVVTRIVSKHKTTAAQIMAELNVHLNSPVSTRTVRRELHRVNIHGRAAIAKPLVTRANAKRRFQWCKERKSWAVDNVKHVLFSDESTFTVFPTSGRVTVWRSPKEAYHPDCCMPRVKHGGGSVMHGGESAQTPVSDNHFNQLNATGSHHAPQVTYKELHRWRSERIFQLALSPNMAWSAWATGSGEDKGCRTWGRH